MILNRYAIRQKSFGIKLMAGLVLQVIARKLNIETQTHA